jgi:hypothetical protein
MPETTSSASFRQAISRRLSSVSTDWNLEQLFIIFSIIYIPVAALYLNQGILAYVLLTLFTFALGTVGLVLLARFVYFVSVQADNASGKFGSVFRLYVTNVFAVFLVYKLLGYVIWATLPPYHQGILCDIVNFVKDLFFLFNVQTALNTALIVSLPIALGLAVLSIGGWTTRRK